jgi:hypothetical protein
MVEAIPGYPLKSEAEGILARDAGHIACLESDRISPALTLMVSSWMTSDRTGSRGAPFSTASGTLPPPF